MTDEATINLRKDVDAAGAKLYTIVRHVSKSGMQRSIQLLIASDEGIEDISYRAAKVLGSRTDRNNGGIVVRGGGMDMTWLIVANLSRALYGEDRKLTRYTL